MNTNSKTKAGLLVQHPYMHLVGHKRLYPESTAPDMVSLKSIAYGLAKECRFAGQIEGFYSVAQHCILMRKYAQEHALCEPHQLIYLLMHDAAEGYLGDIAKPVKVTLPDFNALETRIEHVIADHFGLSRVNPPLVKELDTRIIVDEASQLFDTVPDWVQDFLDAGTQPLGITITPWRWEVALHLFARAFCEDYSAFLKHYDISPLWSGYAHFAWTDWNQLMKSAMEQLERIEHEL
jgi:hypothetical protein